ncbi:hypothetical protein QBC39DRAFT_332569 [Podospora conica]|nr:hypothetical protein QBC39DRAFT_332569 [Schizothecium conicum]
MVPSLLGPARGSTLLTRSRRQAYPPVPLHLRPLRGSGTSTPPCRTAMTTILRRHGPNVCNTVSVPATPRLREVHGVKYTGMLPAVCAPPERTVEAGRASLSPVRVHLSCTTTSISMSSRIKNRVPFVAPQEDINYQLGKAWVPHTAGPNGVSSAVAGYIPPSHPPTAGGGYFAIAARENPKRLQFDAVTFFLSFAIVHGRGQAPGAATVGPDLHGAPRANDETHGSSPVVACCTGRWTNDDGSGYPSVRDTLSVPDATFGTSAAPES